MNKKGQVVSPKPILIGVFILIVIIIIVIIFSKSGIENDSNEEANETKCGSATLKFVNGGYEFFEENDNCIGFVMDGKTEWENVPGVPGCCMHK